MATVAFGQDDEVVAESFGANDELVEGFGQDDEVVKTPEQSDMSEQMAQAGKSGEFWEKVGNALQWIETNAIEPLTRPVSGVVGRALDVVPGIQAEERLKQPLLPLPRAGQAETPAGQIAAGGVNAVADLAEGFSSPDMLAQLPAGVNKLVLATWSALLAKHAPEQFGEAVRLKQEGDLQGAARAAFTGAGEGLMSALIARHAAGPKAEAIPERPVEAVKPEPAAPVGISPGANAFHKIVDYFKPPKDEAVPEMVVDTGTSLPDLQPKDVANQVFSKPFGVEKIPVIGRLFGGRARIRTPKDQAVAAWFAERHGVGPSVASSVGQELGGRVNQVFKVDAEGNLNVAPMKQGASRKISDVFEHLEDYVLTPEQQVVYDASIKPLLDRYHELTDKYDLLPHELEGDYFPRIVTERPQESAATLAGGKRVGAKQRFQKERAFETEAEGWEKGYKYETDVEKRLVTGVEQLYRAVADRRLADDPVLDGKTRQGLIAELREAYAEELGSGEMTEAKIDRIADGLQATGTVWQPGFFGKIFDSETANMLNKEFGREQSSIRRTLANANDFIKALALGFDVGVGQIQLLPTAFRNPAIWAKAQATSIGNMFKPEVWKAFAEANRTEIRELAQHGSSVGRLPEMVSGLSSGVIKSIPGLREAAKPFARQFQSALDVAKVELWKAWRDITPREEHQQLVQSIESMLLNARMESSMVPHGRALAERVLLLAPSYYRGAINLVSSLGDKGVSGKVARQSIGSFMAGSVALYYAVGLASGMDIEDLNKRMDPSRSDFMLWDVEAGGQKMNIGIGGIFRSFIRLAGNMVKTSIETPGNWASLSSEKNPLSRWYRGHAGPTVGIAWDQISGKDFLGTPVSIKDVPQKVAPLWMQDMVQAQGNPEKGLVTVPAQFAGLTTIPATKDQKPHYFQLKDKIRSRVGFEEYLNSVARQARLLKPDKRRAYIAKRIKDDEVAPKYRNEAKRKLLMKMRQ